ncbi:MAG: transposase, partial [Nanoarchaeota archaeon]
MSDENKVDLSKVLAPLSLEQIKSLKKEDLAALLFHEQDLRLQFQSFYNEVVTANVELQQKRLLLQEQYVLLKNQFFAKSSEKTPRPKTEPPKDRKKKKRAKKCQKPSERYPDIPLIKRDLVLETPPSCTLCEVLMVDSGMTESCEFLTVIPMQYAVIEQHRHKYRCPKCHGDIQTTPAPPRICPGSAYSDEMILDVALSKFCDLIPIDRYVKMAARRGVRGLPPQSLIELTHHLAKFLKIIYEKIRTEILLSRVLHADETPHRMLEGGGETSNWYLWGFSSSKSSYFEIHNTRSGDVAASLLSQSLCERLISDVFSGYARAVRITNEQRVKEGKCPILNCYCNAHARRKFKNVDTPFLEESEKFVALYAKIYRLEKIAKKTKVIDPLFAVAFFALNPLVIIECLVSSHNDIVMIFFVLLALYYAVYEKYKRSILFYLVSVSIKFATVFAFPIFFYHYFKKKQTQYLNFTAATGMDV